MIRKTRAVFLTALIALSVLAMGVAVTPVAAEEPNHYIVDDDDVGGDANYSSIQSAIDNASSGDTIEVRNGTYQENVLVDQSGIKLTGNDGATIEGTVEISCNDVILEGFTIDGPDADGAVVEFSNAENVTIRGNNVTADLENNVISIGGWTGPPEVGDVTIEDNEVVGAIGLYPMEDASVEITGNDISGAIAEGVWIAHQGTGLDTVGITIENNDIDDADMSETGAADVKIVDEPADLNGVTDLSDAASAAGTALGANDAETIELWTEQRYLENGTIVVSDGESIQDAIDASTDGVPEIAVQSGTYDGFELDQPVDVVGEDATVTGPVVVSANDVRVAGIDFRNSSYDGSIYEPVLNVTGDNVTVDGINSTVVNRVNEFAISGDNAVLHNSDFVHDAADGAAVVKGDLAADGDSANNLLIEDNSFTNASIALIVGEGDTVEVRGNTFETEASDPVWVAGPGYTDPAESSSVVVTDSNGTDVPDGGLVETDNVAGDTETTHYTYGISDGLSFASAGATVTVPEGTYEEHVTVDTPVTLRSESGPSNTEVVGRIDVGSDNVTVEGFTVRNPGVAPGYGGEIDGIFVGDPSGWVDTDGTVEIRNNVIRDVYGSDRTVEAIHVKHYDAGDPIDGVVIQNNVVENVTQDDAGADGIKLQANVNNVSVVDNEIRDVDGSWAYGIVLTPSASESGTPSDVGIHLNALENIGAVDYDGVGVGIDETESDYASADEAVVTNNAFAKSIDIALLNKNPDESVNAVLNWWGDANGPEESATDGPVQVEPFLTSADAVGDGAETTEFAVSKELEAGVSTLAVPAPTERTVGEMFGDVNGVVYGFEDGQWNNLEADDTLDTMDAVVVSLEDDTRVVVEFERASGDFPSPDAAELDEGWNFVGAPSYGAAEEVFGASSADPSRLMDLFEGARSTVKHDGAYTFGTASDGPFLNPYKGYFVYANDDGSVAANGYAGITAEGAFENGLVP